MESSNAEPQIQQRKRGRGKKNPVGSYKFKRHQVTEERGRSRRDGRDGKRGAERGWGLTTDVWLERRLPNKPFSHYSERKQRVWLPDSSTVELFHDTSEGLAGNASRLWRTAQI